MYLRGSKWNMQRRRRKSNPLLVIFLVALIGVAVYFNTIIVPATPPLFVPTPTPTRAPESFISEARQLFDEGKLFPAIEAYQRAIQADPLNRANFVELSRLQSYVGEYQDAIESAEMALVGNEGYALAHAMRALALSRLGDSLNAEAAIRRALELEPNNPLFHAYYAEVLIDKGDFGDLQRAIDASRFAVDNAPNLLEARRARGYVLLVTGNYQEAVLEYNAALAINDKIPDIYISIGVCYRALGDYAKAIESFNTANALRPADAIPDLEVSRTYAQIGEYEKAVQSAELALNDDPTNPHRYGNLGLMHYQNDDFSAAIANLGIAIHGGRSSDGETVAGLTLDYGFIAQYYYTYGLALARQNRCSEALPIFQALLSGVPNDEFAVFNANEGLNICRALIGEQPTPDPNATPGEETTPEAGTTG